MSKSWTEKELQVVSEHMKKLGHLSFEEFCEELRKQGLCNEKETISDAQFKLCLDMQKAGTINICPRCGEDRMKTPYTHNALSRQADVYVCDNCGMEEALIAASGKPHLPLKYWAFAARLK